MSFLQTWSHLLLYVVYIVYLFKLCTFADATEPQKYEVNHNKAPDHDIQKSERGGKSKINYFFMYFQLHCLGDIPVQIDDDEILPALNMEMSTS